MKKNEEETGVYFELNNWFPGKHYPAAEPFISWMSNDLNIRFNDEKWVKENKLCVVRATVDMSSNYCITATLEWVEKNCPELLTKYRKFLRYPDKYGDVCGQFGHYFLDYEDENIGITWVEEDD